ncbi:MAG: M23 family metallopeptidase, partial [Chloroflexota bacterium]
MRLIFRLIVIGLFLSTSTIHAQETKPFILPVAAPPGPSTWLLGQMYGNTVGAFLNGSDWYEAGQRLHFGLDFSMPCGTEVVAVGDGQVGYIDDAGFGSGPHNLILIHPQAGLVSLYGHLLDTPTLQPGTQVRQGDVIGLSGDPDLTCDSRPHLHLEVRSLDYVTAYNPVSYIAANWHALTAIGPFSYPLFEQDLDNSRQWMSVDDQPIVQFWGRALNDYVAPYPDYRQGLPPVNPPVAQTANPLPERWQMRRLTYESCCSGAWWGAANRLFLIDGSQDQRAAIFEWNTDDGSLVNLLQQAPPPLTSPDGALTVARVNDQIVLHRVADGAEWTVATDNTLPAISADSTHLMWEELRRTVEPGDQQPRTAIWVSNADGTNARIVAAEQGGYARWLDGSRLLVGARQGFATTFTVYNTTNGTVADSSFVLGTWDRLRGMSIAPGGSRILFYLTFQADLAASGIYVLDIQPGAQARQLPFFGGWRWRDANSLFYLPYDPASAFQSLHFYDLATGEDRALTDASF